jgi:hypothetical protein
MGAGALSIAMEAWLWTLQFWRSATLELAEALCGILASRALIRNVIEFLEKSSDPASRTFLSDLCQIQAAHAIGEVSRICAELAYGCGETFADLQVLLDGALACISS